MKACVASQPFTPCLQPLLRASSTFTILFFAFLLISQIIGWPAQAAASKKDSQGELEAPVVKVFPALPFSLATEPDCPVELMIARSADTHSAAIHIYYSGPGDLDAASDSPPINLPPRAFAARYGSRWIPIGSDGRAGHAEGRIFLLRSAGIKSGKVAWRFSAASFSDPHYLYQKQQGKWRVLRKLLPGKSRLAALEKQSPKTSEKESVVAAPVLPEAGLVELKVWITGIDKDERAFAVHLEMSDPPDNLVLIGELRRLGSDSPQQRVPVLASGETSKTLRFKAPFMGWQSDKYIIEIKHEGKSIIEKTLNR